ncbi:MAG: DUF1207 domain-containing protein [Bacteroidales bacterium]|nr:DUF1207 domain-containing protein [Bacteroidales bacterium]
MKIIPVCAILLILSFSALKGQDKEHFFFKDSYILKPFLSEIRSTAIKAELARLNTLDENYYVSDYTGRPFIEVHLGTELPVYYLVNRQKDFKFSAGGFIGNILLIDMFEEHTAPVINTDYFFGLKAAAIKYVDHPYIRNIGLKMVPVFHESTHLGDEFSIHGHHDLPGFNRVNVSYEAWEIAAVINDPDTIQSNLLSAKLGFHRLWNPGKGYYSTDSLETKGLMVPPSEKNYEYYVQLNWQRTRGFLCSGRWMNVLSVEANNRLQFSYDDAVREKRSWNINLYLGWKYLAGNSGHHLGFFFRYYAGIIPYGQFRNTPGYRYAGLSIVYH